MNTFTKTAFMLTATILAAQGLYAQTKLTLPDKKGQPDKKALEYPQKANAAKIANDFTSPWPVYGAQDKYMYNKYVTATGSKPKLTPDAPKASPNAPEDDTMYNYIGFNSAAGLAEDGTTQTGGMVAFNLQPFACDTISSDSGLSPYSYLAKGKIYSFLPIMDNSGKYTKLTRTVYDANTMEKLEQRTVSAPGEKDRVPYLLSYDDKRDVVYAISLGDGSEKDEDDSYYLNILDTASIKLQRIGHLGGYSMSRSKGNISIKGFTATNGTLLIQNSDDSLYICEIDPQTCKIMVKGHTTMPTDYVYGLQPMIYDVNSGYLTINHYDFNNGTQYYQVLPSIADKNGEIRTELLENTPTGFTWFDVRPESKKSYYTYTLNDISDMTVDIPEGSTTATVSFTVPDTDVNGNKIELPSYASDRLKAWFYVDNSYTNATGLPAQVSLGENVSFTVELTPGMHVLTIQLYPLYSGICQIFQGKVVTCGYDAPAAVDNANLNIDGQNATITWTAPTKGRYADFGSTFDASDLTYTVVRSDGKTVAENITETSVTDVLESEEIQTYYYTIYATSHGNTGLGAKTNEVSAGQYLPLPYVNSFDNESCLDGWTILNVNNDGTVRTWDWNYIYNYVTAGMGNNDDWLISPAFKMSNDKLYSISYDLCGRGDLITTVGQGNTVEAQDNVLEELTNFNIDESETKEYYFLPIESGNYNVGLHDYNASDEAFFSVDNFSVKEAADATAPDRVKQLNVVPDANGALGATLTFTLPQTAINGSNVGTLTKATVYDMAGNKLGSTTNVAAGAEVSIKVTAVQGWNSFKVVTANENGEGWPVIIKKFIGPDVPQTMQNLNIKWGEDRTKVVLTWDAPTEGVNGGYVNPEDFTYTIYKYDASNYSSPYIALGEVKGETSVDITILDAPEAQDQYVFAATAKNGQGESDYAKTSIVLGEPYTLPFNEGFNVNGLDHAPWIIVSGKNGQAWTTDPDVYNDKIHPQNGDGLQLLMRNTGVEDGSSTFLSPIIDFTNAKMPVLKVWLHHSDAMPEGAYVTVDATTDGSKNYVAVADTVRLTGNNGWTEHVFNLSKLNGQKAQIGLTAYVPDGGTRIFADNWSIGEATGNDLALTSISQPYMPVVGDTANIAVTVSNYGAQTASNYSVLFNLNGETIYETEADKALEVGKETTFNFTLPISAGMDEYKYSAQVIYDGDDNESNNISEEVALNPTQIDLPAPSYLTLTGDDLEWTAPETMDGRDVTLDFENVPAFTINNIDNWTTYDGDGNITMTFVQYYDNYWPYSNQKLAWMTWSPKEAGCPTAAMWQPYSGEKCLIHFGNYLEDENGRPNNTPDDDWFISPEVKGGTDFSFMTLSNDAGSSIEVLTSSTDNAPESFTNKVTTVTYSETGIWKEVKTTLPDDAKYVAIHTVLDNFGIMVDDIKYTEAKAPVLKGYNVYCDNEAVSMVLTPAAKAEAAGTYAVSAVYDLGESVLSNSVSVTTGIESLTTGKVYIAGGKGCITITGAEGKNVKVYTVSGMTIADEVAQKTETVNVPAGIYIVKAGNTTTKVSVK